MFSFNVPTEAELNDILNSDLLPRGDYQFTVKEMSERVSAANNAMIKLVIAIESNGKVVTVTDYLLPNGKMIFKMKHFFDSIGMEDMFNSGKVIFNQCIGKTGFVSLEIQPGKPKDDGNGNYRDKNSVKDYIKSAAKAYKAPVAIDPSLNDDIGF